MTRCPECKTTVSKIREARVLMAGQTDTIICTVCADTHPSEALFASGSEVATKKSRLTDGGQVE